MARFTKLICALGLAASVVTALPNGGGAHGTVVEVVEVVQNKTLECPCEIPPCPAECPELVEVEHKHHHHHHHELHHRCEHECLNDERAWWIATRWIRFFSGGDIGNSSDILAKDFEYFSDSSNVIGAFGKFLHPGEVTLEGRDNFLSNMPLAHNHSTTILAVYHSCHHITVRWVSHRAHDCHGRYQIRGIDTLEVRARRHHHDHDLRHHGHHHHGHHHHIGHHDHHDHHDRHHHGHHHHGHHHHGHHHHGHHHHDCHKCHEHHGHHHDCHECHDHERCHHDHHGHHHHDHHDHHHHHGHHHRHRCHWRIIHAHSEWNNFWHVAHTDRCESLCHRVGESGRHG